jgi:hypothetical protein
MTATANLGLPFIEAAQAQKHVTHNEALRILDAAIQIAVADRNRNAPPADPAEGARHIVAAGATGAWSGHDDAIASWQDGAWAFLAPKPGWCVWSVADDVLLVYGGSHWRDLRDLRVSLDNAARLGVGTTAAAPNLLAVKSNAALFAAIEPAAGGSGDIRVQLAKAGASDTASVVFSNAYSGRAEFGLVGSDAFKLKVSADGADWTEALIVDPASGALALPRAVVLPGVVAPPLLTADQNDYDPPGLAAASQLRLSSDATRSITGLAGGIAGRVLVVTNVGGNPIRLDNGHAASAAANRFALKRTAVLFPGDAIPLLYDAASLRWRALAVQSSETVVPPQGRLTLSSGVAVTAADIAGAAAIYYTPYAGQAAPIHDGSQLLMADLGGELALALDGNSGHAGYHQAANNFDLYVFLDGAGVPRLGSGPRWSAGAGGSDTSRGTGANEIAVVQGFAVNAATIQLRTGSAAGDLATVAPWRATYVGSFRTTADGQTEDSAAKRLLYNAHNQIARPLRVAESAASWTYSAASYRQANGSSANQVALMRGQDITTVNAEVMATCGSNTSVLVSVRAGVGINSSSINSGRAGIYSCSNTINASPVAVYAGCPGLGYREIRWLELGGGANTQTWYGGGAGVFTGLSGWSFQ